MKVTISKLFIFSLLAMTIKSAHSAAALPTGEKIIHGENAPENTFQFKLEGLDGAPMPDDSDGQVKQVEIQGAGPVEFGKISYSEEGVWAYSISEIAGSDAEFTYDDTIYTLIVEVRQQDVTLVSSMTITKEHDADTAFEKAIFENNFVPAPTPSPTNPSIPAVPSTPNPYVYRFSFTKKWLGGVEDSIDWTLYYPNGSERHKWFNKEIISEDEWYYEGWFSSEMDYYLIENVPEGYKVRYENVGAHAGVTNRCYNGGTIINYKVPKTGDTANPILWAGCALLGVGAICGAVGLRRRKKTKR